jgi:hypothetical protein
MGRFILLPLGIVTLVTTMTSPVFAYIDPGTGSIFLQALIGGIAAFLFVIRGYFYKLRNLLSRGFKRGGKASDK